ncbi:MAG TPA: rubrerythrin family protein, partial [Allocoleopsis sp.]
TTQAESPTLKNLQAAYNGESNAHVMYLAFADKADQEGYKEVASLFRAAAKAEQIHRDNHAHVIQTMGATPQNTITTPEVGTTAENLDKAIKGESYERDSMYPKFIAEAKAENNQAALQTLNYALTAEAQHAKLYTEAKNDLSGWRAETHPFYVCTSSGETVASESETSSCPSVTSGKTYESVS